MSVMLSSRTILRRPLTLNSGLRVLSSSPKDDATVVLYHRANNRVLIPRFFLCTSTVNAFYWFWYNFDFIPAVNSSKVEALHVDPAFGLFGVGFSLLTYTATLIYPRYLLSKLEYDETTQNITAYTHDLPTIFQSTVGVTYPLGAFTLDIASPSSKGLLDAQEYFRGSVNLTAKDGYLPFMMDVQDNDVFNSQRLLPIIMTPERVVNVPNRPKKDSQDSKSHQNLKKKQFRRR